MSAPLISYSEGKRVINGDAIRIFLAIALPLLALTIAVWVVLQWQKGPRKPRAQVAEEVRLESL